MNQKPYDPKFERIVKVHQKRWEQKSKEFEEALDKAQQINARPLLEKMEKNLDALKKTLDKLDAF